MVKRYVNILKLLGKNSSAFLFGPRGTGKTQLANEFLNNRDNILSYNLLEFNTYQRFLTNPAQLFKEVEFQLKKVERLIILIDEVQKVPAILDEVHNLMESYKGRLQFLLTGSSARKLKRQGANLLGGRALNLKLHPITYLEDPDLDLDSVLKLGSLPGIIYNNENPLGSLRSYIETYLKEEIQQEALVRRIDAFSRFLEIAAQYNGQIVNASSIAKNAGISSNTVSEYFQILEDTLLGWRIYGWSASVKKQLRLAPKFYLFDNGVCNALRGELNIELRPQTSRYGNLFESWIVQECIRINHYKELDFKFSYWRTSSDQEVDIIISRGAAEPLAGIEIKSQTMPENKDLSGLKSFQAEYPKAKLFCISRAVRKYEIAGIEIIPWQDMGDILSSL